MIYQLRYPLSLLAIVLSLALGVFLHDAVQVLAGQALGDPTARRSGRFFAGPVQRIDPYGAVAAVIVGYGWATPVAMDERWRARRRRVACALATGPLTYLALTFAAAAAVRGTQVASSAQRALVVSTFTFAALFIVSILPTPPLDGGRIMFLLAPQSLAWQKARYRIIEQNFGLVALMAIILIPKLFPTIPSLVGELAADVVSSVGSAVGTGSVLSLYGL